MKNNNLYIIIVLTLSFIYSCEKDYLDTSPKGSVSSEQISSDPIASAKANQVIINGIFANMRSYDIGGSDADVDYGHKGIDTAMDMMGHDIVLNSFNWYVFIYNYEGRVANSTRSSMVWNSYYTFIADANSVINSINNSENLTDDQKALLGQALTIKSFCLFNLIRAYSLTYIGNQNDPGIPIPDRLSFGPQGRGTVQKVYDEIIPSLEKSVNLLEGFNRETKQAIDQSVAQGILARVYLESGNWSGAADMANKAKQNYQLMTGQEWVNDGFSEITNKEWMWGADINTETSTGFASFFSHFDNTKDGYGGDKLIDSRLYNLIPDTDLRKTVYIDPVDGNDDYPDLPGYAALKFIGDENFEGDYSYMRVSEMWLIEAEAKARLNAADAANVLFDLVSLRDSGYTLSNKAGNDLVEEIYLQRRIELWGEGFSWYDLKRLKKPLQRTGGNHLEFGLIDEVAEGKLFKWQIPQDEINANDLINQADQND